MRGCAGWGRSDERADGLRALGLDPSAERPPRAGALAPQATLRFRLLPRAPGVDMHGITLRVLGDEVALPVAVADAVPGWAATL